MLRGDAHAGVAHLDHRPAGRGRPRRGGGRAARGRRDRRRQGRARASAAAGPRTARDHRRPGGRADDRGRSGPLHLHRGRARHLRPRRRAGRVRARHRHRDPDRHRRRRRGPGPRLAAAARSAGGGQAARGGAHQDPAAHRRLDLRVHEQGDREPARRGEQPAPPGPPAGSRRHPGLLERGRHPRARADGQRPVPHQRDRPPGGRHPLRAERRAQPPPGELDHAPHRRAARRVRPPDHRHLRHPDQERRLRPGRPRRALRRQPRLAPAQRGVSRGDRPLQLLRDRRLPPERHRHLSRHTQRRDPRRHPAGPRLRLLRVPARRDQQGQRDRRELRRPLPDPQPSQRLTELHGQRRLGLRLT